MVKDKDKRRREAGFLHPFPHKLSEERLKRALSYEALAALSGVSPGTVRRLEAGRGQVAKLVKVAKALGLSLRRLLA